MTTITGLPGSPPAVFEDASLPHQIRISVANGFIALSCTCQPYGRHIESRKEVPAREALAAYRQWHADHGEPVQP